MEKFIGQAAGILMILLIVVLFIYFIRDVGVIKETNKAVLRSLAGPAAASLGIAFVYIFAGGLIYNFWSHAVSIFSIDEIWQFEPLDNDIEGFSAYNLMVRGFAKLLFDKQEECRLYISLLCGVITGVATSFRYAKIFDRDMSNRCFELFLCMPGIMFVFLPSPLSVFLMIFSLCLLVDAYDKKYLAVILAAISVAFSISGIAVFIMCFFNLSLKKKLDINVKLRLEAIVVAVAQVFIVIYCALGVHGSEPEYWIVLIPVLVSAFGTMPWLKKDSIYVPVLMITALLSGYYLLYKMSFVL